ncbi:hypothetical protein EYZ11_006079 [Aspergillus tanneri]|uniref:Uncharacterized protein n=1 Tax=Aspergillus tanneri TaxID=1220188 RepID=A0A4S3JGP3_9EURO|nr:hypothetical protein EYZ11_006079 [Aspergillus tanneri]
MALDQSGLKEEAELDLNLSWDNGMLSWDPSTEFLPFRSWPGNDESSSCLLNSDIPGPSTELLWGFACNTGECDTRWLQPEELNEAAGEGEIEAFEDTLVVFDESFEPFLVSKD